MPLFHVCLLKSLKYNPAIYLLASIAELMFMLAISMKSGRETDEESLLFFSRRRPEEGVFRWLLLQQYVHYQGEWRARC